MKWRCIDDIRRWNKQNLLVALAPWASADSPLSPSRGGGPLWMHFHAMIGLVRLIQGLVSDILCIWLSCSDPMSACEVLPLHPLLPREQRENPGGWVAKRGSAELIRHSARHGIYLSTLDLTSITTMSQNKISFALGSSDVGTASTSTAGMSNMERLLAAAKTKLPVKAKPSAATLFADEDDDSAPQTPSTLLAGPFKPRPQPRAAASSMSRAEKRAQAEALRVDATVFDYDGVYDGMKAAERQVEQAKKLEDAERKPKYIENFLASAQTRRLDKLRAEEKMLQLEREKEGDEFVDKEKFVTEAYKKQMEEVRKAEEEEKQREGECRPSC